MDQIQEPVVRLIIDHQEKKIGPSIGIPEKRADDIFQEVVNIYQKNPKVSGAFKEISETYYHPGEFSYALFCLGEVRTQSNCPLHKGGFMGFLFGGRPPGEGE